MCDNVWEVLGQEPWGLLLCFNELSGATALEGDCDSGRFAS